MFPVFILMSHIVIRPVSDVMCLCCQVDFQDAEARTVTERRREEERQRKMERIYKERVEAASKDMEGKHHTMVIIITTTITANNNKYI